MPHLILISLIAGFWADINMTFAAVKIVAFYPYFMAGYLFSQEMSEKFQAKKFFPRGLILLILTICASIFLHETFNLTDKEILPSSYENINGLFGRISILAVSILAILTLLISSVEKNIPLLTQVGRNSLAIYLLHRPFTIWFSEKFSTSEFQIFLAIVATFLMTVILGSEIVSNALKKFLNNIVESLTTINGAVFRIIFSVFVLLVMCLPLIGYFSNQRQADKIYRAADSETVARFNN